MVKKTYVIIKGICVIFFICQLLSCVSTAPGDIPPAGTVWFTPGETETMVDEGFSIEMHVNTGKQKLAAYTFYLTYLPNIVEVDTEMGTNGVEPGPDGFLIAVNASDPGKLYIGGYDIHGKGPGNNLHILTTYWKGMAIGYIKVKAEIINLNDEKTHIIGTPKGIGAKVKVR